MDIGDFGKIQKVKRHLAIKTFPELHVYGASVRGAVFSGIGNMEIAYYNSR